jgi:hypothetical protein
MHCSCHAAPARGAAEFNFFAACGAYGYSRDGSIRAIFFLNCEFMRRRGASAGMQRGARESGISPALISP